MATPQTNDYRHLCTNEKCSEYQQQLKDEALRSYSMPSNTGRSTGDIVVRNTNP